MEAEKKIYKEQLEIL